MTYEKILGEARSFLLGWFAGGHNDMQGIEIACDFSEEKLKELAQDDASFEEMKVRFADDVFEEVINLKIFLQSVEERAAACV